MQLKTLPGLPDSLNFDDIIPVSTSTSRVAASAFYHCLGKHFDRVFFIEIEPLSAVLATKDLVEVEQPEPYGNLRITVL